MSVPAAGVAALERDVHVAMLAPQDGQSLRGEQDTGGCPARARHGLG